MTRTQIGSRVLVFFALVASPAVGHATRNQTGGKPTEVAICHIPPGNPDNAHTITVGSAAVEAHLAHGDIPGVCAPLCHTDGAACGDHAECCNGYCSNGACATPCGANGSDCGADGQCCSGLCEDGLCSAPCTGDGNACGSNVDCCSGNCHSGTCIAACGTDDSACATGNDCCSGICAGTTKTCASDCTVGPEFGGPECSSDLDCCQGNCIYGNCYGELACALPDEPCDQLTLDCCFDAICTDDGDCVAP